MQAVSHAYFEQNLGRCLESVAASTDPLVIEPETGPELALVPAAEWARLQSELAACKVRFDRAERVAQLGHWEWDEIEDRCTYCSDELARMHGTSVAEFLRATTSLEADLDWIHPDDQRRFANAARRLRQDGQPFSIEYRARRPDGGYRLVREEAEPVFDDSGRTVVQSFGVLQDLTGQVAAENDRQEREVLLKMAMRAAKIGAWIWDDEAERIEFCSEELAALFDQTVEEYIATRGDSESTAARIHPDDRSKYLAAAAVPAEAGRRYMVEFRERSADGTYRDFLEFGEAFIDGNGRPKWAGVLQDVGEWRAMENQLRQREAALARAQRLGQIGSWEWDCCKGQLTAFSEEFARIHGFEGPDAATGLDSLRLHKLHPDDEARVIGEYRRIEEMALDYELEYRIIRADGAVRHIVETGETVTGDDGRASLQTGIIQDITERKLAEEQLREYREELERLVDEKTRQLKDSEGRFRRIFDNAGAGIGSLDLATGQLHLRNRRFAQLLGYERTADSIEQFRFNPGTLAQLQPGSAAPHRHNWQAEVMVRTRDEAEVVLQFFLSRSSASGSADFVTIDVTEQRAAEARLHQALRMEAIGQLTGGVAHDFNNLLAIIQGHAELVRRRIGGDDRSLAEVLHACNTGSNLTHRLLAFSRNQPLSPRQADAGELVGSSMGLITRSLGPHIYVSTRIQKHLPSILVDPAQLENVVINLTLNARDAMPDGGELLIECAAELIDERHPLLSDYPEARSGEYVVISVADSGTGMDDWTRARAFEPFFTTKEVGAGSGLGLSMAYGFAGQSNGYLRLVTQPGRGTIVSLYLPAGATPTHANDRAAPAPSIIEGRGEQILVVEDEPAVLATIVQMLTSLHYQVQCAPDVATATSMLAGGLAPDAVLTDMALPGGQTGLSLTNWLRNRHPELPVVYMSGYVAGDPHADALVGQAAHFLPKPFSLEALSHAMRSALDRPDA